MSLLFAAQIRDHLWYYKMAWLSLKKNYAHAIESLPESTVPRPMSLTNVDVYKKAALNTSMDQETKDVYGAFQKRTL